MWHKTGNTIVKLLDDYLNPFQRVSHIVPPETKYSGNAIAAAKLSRLMIGWSAIAAALSILRRELSRKGGYEEMRKIRKQVRSLLKATEPLVVLDVPDIRDIEKFKNQVVKESVIIDPASVEEAKTKKKELDARIDLQNSENLKKESSGGFFSGLWDFAKQIGSLYYSSIKGGVESLDALFSKLLGQKRFPSWYYPASIFTSLIGFYAVQRLVDNALTKRDIRLLDQAIAQSQKQLNNLTIDAYLIARGINPEEYYEKLREEQTKKQKQKLNIEIPNNAPLVKNAQDDKEEGFSRGFRNFLITVAAMAFIASTFAGWHVYVKEDERRQRMKELRKALEALIRTKGPSRIYAITETFKDPLEVVQADTGKKRRKTTVQAVQIPETNAVREGLRSGSPEAMKEYGDILR